MAKDSQIIIIGMGSISPLGADPNSMWRNYRKATTKIQRMEIGGDEVWCAPVGDAENEYLHTIRNENKKFRHIDRSVLMAIYAARQATKLARWSDPKLSLIHI